jgi:uncharacterized membrane protein YfcA
MSAGPGLLSALLGLVVGAFGTFIGAGGGFLLVPILLLWYHFAPADAVGTSLALVFLNALSGSIAYLRQRRVDLALGWRFAAATLPGAVGGAYLTRVLASRTFSLAFGIALLAIAALLFWGRRAGDGCGSAPGRSGLPADGDAVPTHPVDVRKGVAVSFAVGFVSSVFGIGGGIIHVPFLIVVLGLPVHVATATSHFVLSISTLVGAGTFLTLGHVDVTLVALIGVGILIGAQVGAWASRRARSAVIRLVLATSLALVAVRMIVHAAGAAP